MSKYGTVECPGGGANVLPSDKIDIIKELLHVNFRHSTVAGALQISF